ncbi:MAG: hypothetical protein NXI22_20760 [bacterium]|nr:hypothetical protein [bacterium]
MRTLLCSWFAFSIALATAGFAIGAEPTIKELIDSTPRLTPSDENLKSFQFSFETSMMLKTKFCSKVVWSRKDGFGMLVEAGEEQIPLWFLSEEKSMFFDASSGKVVLGDSGKASFELQTGKENLNINFGLQTKDDATVLVDLPSLFINATEDAKLSKDEAGNFVVTLQSKSGRTDVMAVYDQDKPHTLRSIELRDAKTNAPLFAVRDIRVNETKSPNWPAFPAKEAFPEELQVHVLWEKKENESMISKIALAASVVRSQMALVALLNPENRQSPIFIDINWERAERVTKTAGPKLRKLLQADAIFVAESQDATLQTR